MCVTIKSNLYAILFKWLNYFYVKRYVTHKCCGQPVHRSLCNQLKAHKNVKQIKYIHTNKRVAVFGESFQVSVFLFLFSNLKLKYVLTDSFCPSIFLLRSDADAPVVPKLSFLFLDLSDKLQDVTSL